jgi:glycosyltransferase involved in cell wall biosynthesis
MPEIVGDSALLVDPYSVEELSGALARLLSNEALRTELVMRGFVQAANFTWARAAQQLKGIYQRMLGD